MSAPPTSSFNLSLTAEQRRAIDLLAERERVSAEQAVIRAVERALLSEPGSEESRRSEAAALPEGTPFHGLADLLGGVGDGPSDLSANKDYLADLGSGGRL